jgi:hypothetical protein
MTARVLNLAAVREEARQRRTTCAPEPDCMTIAQAGNNALRTKAALQLMSDPDFIPCDTDEEHA